MTSFTQELENAVCVKVTESGLFGMQHGSFELSDSITRALHN